MVRAVSTSVAMRASLNLIAWNFAIGWPNCSRSLAYLSAASSAAWETPTERAACVIRPPSSVPVTCLKPPSMPPSSAAAGTLMASKARAAVPEAVRPGFLPLGAKGKDGDAADPRGGGGPGRKAEVPARDPLDRGAANDLVAAAPAVLLGVAHAQVAETAELAEEVHGEGLGALQLLDARGERLLGEAPDGEAKALLLLVQAKAEHGGSSGGGL